MQSNDFHTFKNNLREKGQPSKNDAGAIGYQYAK